MATVQTLSPSSDGRCLLQSSNSETVGSLENFPIPNDSEKRDHVKSAPEAADQEENIAGKPWKGRRRKRRNSFNEHSNIGGGGNSNQNGKRRRGNGPKRQAGGRIILPNKFLLGGNISDPLNLNSMMDEKVNRALNAVTPSSSPLPPRNSTIDIVQPSDVTDPLGLNSSGFEKPTVPIETSKQKKRKRRRKSQAAKQEQQQNSDATSNSDDQKISTDSSRIESNTKEMAHISSANVSEMKKSDTLQQKKNSPPKGVSRLTVPPTQVNVKDPIVSPVVPQDIHRYRSSFPLKSRRRRRGGQAASCNTSLQVDDTEIHSDEQFRSRSEKTLKTSSGSKVRRRRTLSEHLPSERFWENDMKEARTEEFMTQHYSATSVYYNRDLSNLLSSKSGPSLTSGDVQNKESEENFMNKEMKVHKRKRHSHSPANRRSLSTDGKRKSKKEEKSEDRKHTDEDAFKANPAKQENKNKQQPHFQYGNYNKYYGYRNPEKFKDVRMEVLKKDWFKDKDVLDIGCNAGHLTLLIARDYEPRKIVGIDIDDSLIHTARKNIRHYASVNKSSTKFPASMVISFGPLAIPPVETGKDETTAAFPNNVNFFQGNYVPQKDEFLRFQEPEYDLIMCMSVTKWIHLNWGDEGLIRMFRRVFKQLRAGGMFILEPQQWKSYKSKKRMTAKLNETFHSIAIMPQSFPDFLLREVGFERVEHLSLPKKNKAAGFQRPIQVYYKPE